MEQPTAMPVLPYQGLLDETHFYFSFFQLGHRKHRDLSSPTRGQTHAPAVRAWIPNHRIAREVLKFFAIFLIEVLEKALATHSSTLAWKIPWMEEAGGLHSMGSRRVRHH